MHIRVRWVVYLMFVTLMGCANQAVLPKPSPQPPLLLGDGGSSPRPTPPATLPELIAMLSNASSSYQERIVAAEALANMGARAAPAIPVLIDNLQHDDIEVRLATAHSLGSIGIPAKAAVPALLHMLVSRFSRERSAAAEALGKLGDTSAIPSLAHTLYDKDEFVAIEAAKAIGHLAHQAFPDMDGSGYSVGENGLTFLVTAARQWWEQKGQNQDWPAPVP